MTVNLYTPKEYLWVQTKSIPSGYFPLGIIDKYLRGMEKYELRRQKLIKLRDTRCGGVNATLAKAIDRDETYINRLFYPLNKKGGKRLGDKLIWILTEKFELPVGWFDSETDSISVVYDAETKFILDKLLSDQKFKAIVGTIARMNTESISNLKSDRPDKADAKPEHKSNGTEHHNGTE